MPRGELVGGAHSIHQVLGYTLAQCKCRQGTTRAITVTMGMPFMQGLVEDTT